MVWLPDHIWEAQQKAKAAEGGATKGTSKGVPMNPTVTTSKGSAKGWGGPGKSSETSKPHWEPSGSGGKGSGSSGGGVEDVLKAFGLMAMMAGATGGGGGGWKGGGKSWSKNPKPVDESGGVLGEFKGTIKSFSDRTFYGFIECDQLKAQGYQDVFLFGDMKKGYQVGNVVKFTAVLNKEGKPVAKDLKSGLK